MEVSKQEWSDCKEPISVADLSELEYMTNFRLPEKYKNLLKVCNGGMPSAYVFNYYDKKNNSIQQTCIGEFIPYIPKKIDEGLLWLFHSPPDLFPSNLFIFAADPGGDYICFRKPDRADLASNNIPVVYWNHERAGTPEAISPLAPNFETFLGMLKSEEEAEKEYEALRAK